MRPGAGGSAGVDVMEAGWARETRAAQKEEIARAVGKAVSETAAAAAAGADVTSKFLEDPATQKALKEAGEEPVQPLRTMGEHEAHNMACISGRGLYRRPNNASIAVHFLKTVSAMRYVGAVLRKGTVGVSTKHTKGCCARMVWPTERRRHAPRTCEWLLSPDEVQAEAAIDAQPDDLLGAPAGGRGRGRGRNRRGKRHGCG